MSAVDSRLRVDREDALLVDLGQLLGDEAGLAVERVVVEQDFRHLQNRLVVAAVASKNTRTLHSFKITVSSKN